MSEKIDVIANSDLIKWLLYDSGISRYKISKETGISEATLSRISSGGTPIDQVRFGFARKLTEYAERVQVADKGEGGLTDDAIR